MLDRVKAKLMQEHALPALSWSVSALAVAAGFAVHELHSVWKVNWAMVGIVVLSCVLLQSLVGDWIGGRGTRGSRDAAGAWRGMNGTDRTKKMTKTMQTDRICRTNPTVTHIRTPVDQLQQTIDPDRFTDDGLYRMESGVPGLDAWQAIDQAVLVPDQARMLGRLAGCLGVVSLGIYAARDLQSSLWLCALVGLWVLLAYASHSFSSVPVLTEWLTVFPVMVASTLGTYFVLSEGWEQIIAWGAGLHALLSVAWLMQMHLRDVVAEAGHHTTVAWIARRIGLQATPHVPAAYFLLTAFFGTLATLQVAHVFVLTVLCSLLGAISSWNTRLDSVEKITEQYRKMIVMTMAHGVMVAFWVSWM